MRDDTAIADTQTGDSEAREVRSKKDLDLECEEGFRIILDSIRDGVIRVDEFRRVVLMNRVAEEMTGWRLDTTNENPLQDIFRLHFEDPDADDPVETVLLTGKPAVFPDGTVLVSASGKRNPVSGRVFPVHGDGEDLDGAIIIFQDVTERLKKERKIRNVMQQLEVINENLPNVIWIADIEEDGTFTNTYSSGAVDKLLALPPGVTVKDDWDEYIFTYILPEYRAGVYEAFEKAIRNPGEMVTFEYEVRRGDGKRAWFSSTGRVLNEDGKLRVFGSTIDITERKLAEQEQIKLVKLESLGMLAGGIAHDFNNILMGLFGNLELALLRTSSDHPAYPFLSQADHALERARNLTDQLLTFAKGGDPLLAKVDLKSVVQNTVSFILSGSNVKVNYEFPDDLWKVKADEGQISQVITNLAMNAKEAMPHGGNLYIEGANLTLSGRDRPKSLTGDFVMLSIRDEGVGIPQENLERIFDPYFSTKQTGSGLGLAIVQSIVTKHGGTVEVESSLGEGTVFTLYLPAEMGDEEEVSHRPPETKERLEGSSGRVLVMDDEFLIQDVAAEMLEALGYEVLTVSEGGEAIKRYEKARREGRPFDVVIMDMTVPGGMGGLEAARRLLELDPEAQVIVSSGYSTDPVITAYEKYGFAGKLIKPYRINDLKEELSRVMANEKRGSSPPTGVSPEPGDSSGEDMSVD